MRSGKTFHKFGGGASLIGSTFKRKFFEDELDVVRKLHVKTFYTLKSFIRFNGWIPLFCLFYLVSTTNYKLVFVNIPFGCLLHLTILRNGVCYTKIRYPQTEGGIKDTWEEYRKGDEVGF